jgi:hypothetical protein
VDKTQVTTMMAAMKAKPDPSTLKGVAQEEVGNIQEMLEDYEIKETSIIHDLYSQHFFPKDQMPKLKPILPGW